MIKEALEFLAKIQTPKHPVTHKVNAQEYSVNADGTLGKFIPEIDDRNFATPMALTTLSGLVQAYESKVHDLGERVALKIVDPFTVHLIDLDADDFGKVKTYAIATHVEEKPFSFDTYMEPEPFLIAFRARFLYTENAIALERLCSSVASGAGVAVSDDGISQEVTFKNGTITKASTTLPSDGVELIPVRTFRDANPVSAKFLLRMKGVKDALPKIALFEIDPMWKLYAVGSIRKYLEGHLPEATIIA